MRKLKSSSFKVSDSEPEYQIESINYVSGSLTKVSTHQVFELSDWKEALSVNIKYSKTLNDLDKKILYLLIS